ncbi:HAD family hydrolase [Acidaminobacter sp. JC074]|uniref:HAD family hydrolase n=1 Tax=Acidaminobacter sp. JC074 TaxID=2530199 RepID=UPI001F113D3B|nr:HAD-IA family hydrolase [Acidaminobacter sp. JC074]MCH4889548.1 HAD family hydrolase [Acidaminobacter sp. JC074]
MIKAVIFDFDGTLINTNQLIKIGLNKFSQKYLKRKLSELELSNLNGKHLSEQMAYIAGDNASQAVIDFKRWYTSHHDAYATGFIGIRELLEILKHEKIKMGIVTNNSSQPLKQGLSHLAYGKYFTHLITSDNVKRPKPDPEGILNILKMFDLRPDEILYVGDSSSDMRAAKAAGVLACLVDWTSLSDLEKRRLSPDYMIHRPFEIFHIIKKINHERMRDQKSVLA